MKIFNAEQIRQWDSATMERQQISQTALMQRAADCAAGWITRKFSKQTSFCLVCGKGGNGGDGLVIARHLLLKGYKVSIILLTDPRDFRGATLDQWQFFTQDFPAELSADITILETKNDQQEFTKMKAQACFNRLMDALHQSGARVIIDAILGTGYQPEPVPSLNHQWVIKNRARYITLLGIMAINTYSYGEKKYRRRKTLSIDIPSGLSPDLLPAVSTATKSDAAPDIDAWIPAAAGVRNFAPSIVRADYTLSFQTYKRSFMHLEAAKYVGKIKILDIGLCPIFFHRERTRFLAVDLRAAVRRYQPRLSNPFGHKGSFGTAVLIGGSYGKIGAIGLSAKAALKTGVGKVFIQAPKCGYEILQTLIPEAMFEPAGDSYVAAVNPIKKATYGLGPGMDTHPETGSMLFDFLKNQQDPVLLDADALNIMAKALNNFLPVVPKNSILTPHPGEFSRLFGPSASTMDQVDLASEMAQKWQLVIVLKGHHTAICGPEGKIHYNLTGNAGMATAGSGDVLSGIITSFLAQGIPPKDAAILGVYIHGLAGDAYIKKGSPESLIAEDLINHLPGVFRKLVKYRKKLHLK